VKFAKYLLSLGLVFFVSGCVTEMMPGQYLEEEVVSFQRVVEAPGHSRDEIYSGTRIWIAENFKSSKAVIELDSKEEGLLIGNGRMDYPCEGFDCFGAGGQTVSFTMRVDMQDDRFRLTFSNISIRHPASSGMRSFETPIQFKVQKERIEPLLLRYGDAILNTIKKADTADNW